MTHPSKDKGNRFERRIVNLAKSSGLNAKRAYGSNGEALGYHATVDVDVEGYAIQCKVRKSIANYLQPNDEQDAVALRQDYGDDLIVLRYADFLDLLKACKIGEEAIKVSGYRKREE